MMTVEQYWENFVQLFPSYKGKTYEAWSFGVDEDTLAELVKQGEKRLRQVVTKLIKLMVNHYLKWEM